MMSETYISATRLHHDGAVQVSEAGCEARVKASHSLSASASEYYYTVLTVLQPSACSLYTFYMFISVHTASEPV